MCVWCGGGIGGLRGGAAANSTTQSPYRACSCTPLHRCPTRAATTCENLANGAEGHQVGTPNKSSSGVQSSPTSIVGDPKSSYQKKRWLQPPVMAIVKSPISDRGNHTWALRAIALPVGMDALVPMHRGVSPRPTTPATQPPKTAHTGRAHKYVPAQCL